MPWRMVVVDTKGNTLTTLRPAGRTSRILVKLQTADPPLPFGLLVIRSCHMDCLSPDQSCLSVSLSLLPPVF